MTVFTRRLATESTIVRGLRANGFTNPWFCRFFTSFCMFLLVASCNVYAETFFRLAVVVPRGALEARCHRVRCKRFLM